MFNVHRKLNNCSRFIYSISTLLLLGLPLAVTAQNPPPPAPPPPAPSGPPPGCMPSGPPKPGCPPPPNGGGGGGSGSPGSPQQMMLRMQQMQQLQQKPGGSGLTQNPGVPSGGMPGGPFAGPRVGNFTVAPAIMSSSRSSPIIFGDSPSTFPFELVLRITLDSSSSSSSSSSSF